MQGFDIRARLTIAIRPVMIVEVVDLAVAPGLTAYDASYLWLARRLNAQLLTLDRRLTRAAGADA